MPFHLIDLSPRPSPPWGNYDFEKPSLVAIASSQYGDLLLAAVGGHARLEIEEVGLEHPADLGLEPPSATDNPNEPAAGIWVWEGKYTHHRDGDGYDSEPVGVWRRPTATEAFELVTGGNPWNDDEWKLPPAP